MILNVGQITLIDFIDAIKRKEIVINKMYQRGSGVWPTSASTYFIDTILEGYPFPKIYLYQTFNDKSKRPIKEVVDGQQRISTIMNFMEDKFTLTTASKQYSGMRYSDLDEDVKNNFILYQIEVSTILSAARSELLEMFRRINSYTAPLAAAEKRHATYQGKFKWFIVEAADKYSPLLENLSIFTSKQLARMQDAEFISDMVLSLEKGVIQKSAQSIERLYKSHDVEFDQEQKYNIIIDDFFHFLSIELTPLHTTFLMKSYVVHSLFTAYAHCKYGIPDGESSSLVVPNEELVINLDRVIPMLEELALAHELQDVEGRFREYVKACLSSTTKTPQRTTRFKLLCNVLVS